MKVTEEQDMYKFTKVERRVGKTSLVNEEDTELLDEVIKKQDELFNPLTPKGFVHCYNPDGSVISTPKEELK